MGKIVKPLQPKHRETLSPWLKEFVAKVADAPLPKIPQLLAEFPTTWPFSRGDLYHWIPLLNRFDSILECFCATYHLSDGPQARDFTCEVLLNKGAPVEYCDDRTWTQADLQALGYGQDGDSALIVTILKFSGKLLEHCGNRSVYSSSAHLNDLLNSTSLVVLRATLEVGMELAQRYHASVKRMAHPSRQIGAALLASHYNIDLDRVQQLSQPFAKTPIINFSADTMSVTPASATKGKEKEKAQIPAAKNSASMFANDLVSLATSEPQDEGRWHGWGDIKVVYYPRAGIQAPPPTPAQQPTVPDRVHSTLPSTPTPLRRSSTMGSVQHRSPRADRTSGEDASSPVTPHISGLGNDEAAKSPQKAFEITQSAVLKTPIYELLSRFPDDMPQSARYEVLNRLRVAKALLDSPSTRQDALAVRLLAIANLSYIHQEAYFLEKVLRQDNDEPRRYQLVYQLAELIHPVQDGRPGVPLWLQTITFQLLEAISHFTSKQSDVLSALNANVNHGILLYVIRKAVAGMREDTEDEDDTQRTEADDWRNSLFSLTLHMSVSARLGTEMIGAGIMENLVEILNIRTRVADRNHSMSLAFLDGLIYSYQGAFQSFVDAKGLDRISELTVDIVKKATEMTKAGNGTPPSLRSSVVDYEIPFYQQQTLKWLLKFIHHIMTSWYSFGSNTDRLLRNLVDNSELLASLSHVIENMSCFGSVVWTNAMIIIGDFINNDPTSFAALMEAGLIKSFLQSITGREVKAEHPNERMNATPQAADDDAGSAEPDDSILFEPDDRPHPPARETLEASRSEPLARGILPSSEAMLVIPTVINSISLNNAGMKMVVSSRVIESYFEIFESAKHVRCLDTDLDHAANIGSSFDELARHHPSLRPAISNAVLDMVARVVHLGREKAAKQSWGASLSVPNPAGGSLVADTSLLDKSGPAVLQGQDTVMATSGPDSHDSPALGDAEQSAKNFTPYVTAVANFLSTFTGNTSLKTTFIHKGGIELLLDVSELPSLPHDFADSKGAKVLQHVVSSLVENCPILGLPSLLKRTQAAVDALQPLVQHKGPQLFFAPFVRPDLSLVTESGEWDQQVIQQIAHGTQAVKALLTTQCLVKTLYNSLPQSNRQAISFPAVNVFDYYARLIETLGPLLRAVLAQEMDIAKIVPSHWPNSTALGEEQPAPSVDAAAGAVGGATLDNQTASAAESAEAGGGARPTEPLAASTSTSSSGKSVSPDEAKSISYKNYEVLRVLLHSMMPTSYPFFQGLGKALLPRRERDPWTRSQHLWIAEMLAKTIQAKWESSKELTVKDIHYSVVMLHSVDEMLTDTPRQTDRGSATVIIPVLVAFKEHGGFDTLHAMLRQFAEVAAKESDAAPSDSRPRLAKIGMKKILELYLTVVSGKNVWDSVQQVNLAQRPDQRRDTSPIGAQLLVELRMSILPVVRELWDSPLIEKADVGVLNRVVNILKAIADVSYEANAYKKTDKQPPALFKREAVPFPWNDHIRIMMPLIDRGEDVDLAREAVYRSFGAPEWAEEYIKAHKAGIAGTRNPVPPQDAYQEDGPSEAVAPEVQAPALTGTVVVGGDPMAVDPVPELDRLVAVSETLSERPAPSAPAANAAAEASSRAPETQEAGGASSSSARPSQTPSKTPSTPQPPAVTKEDLDAERAKLRKDLIDRCLDVIRAHPTSVYDVADLISITVPLKSDANEEARQEVGETLANALISFDADDVTSATSIAAYAHLLSILLQDSKPFFRACVDTIKMNVCQYLLFLKTKEEYPIPPWIPYILLIFEIVLTDDEQPFDAKWPVPSADAETMPKLELVQKDPIVNQDERRELFQAVMEILPRAGVNDMLAIAILRILLILTRDREFAKAAGEKKQLHRIFAMAKQLSVLGSTRFKETKIGLYVMTILRHIVEDDDTIRQILRFEIRAFFDASARSSRTLELHTYLRSLSPFSMRSPRLFIEVTQEMVKIPKWPSNAEDGQPKQFLVVLKEPPAAAPTNEAQASKDKDAPKDDSVEPAVQQATQDLNINDVKPTTESGDKEMTDAPKTPGAEAKRPIVENPDGVINFLLEQLLSFQKVDAEPVNAAATSKDKSKETASPTATGGGSSSSSSSSTSPQSTSASEQALDDAKDKKQQKTQFKAEEHPIFVYRCFLLHCLSELLYSYNRAKIEFINFKRGAPLLTNTPVKPRSSVLNYLLNDLLCVNSLQAPSDSLAYKKKVSTADQARMVLVALVAKTGEKPINRHARRFDPSDEADLNFVRKFVLDTVLRAYREAASSGESFDIRYGKMQSLAELMYNMIDDKETKDPIRNIPDAPRSQAQLKRLMYEKGYIAALTSSIADVDLTYPGVKRTIKYILRVLRFLTNTAILLSADGVLPPSSADNVEDEILSASSLSDLDEEREETPDLYRNSALGMLEPREDDDFTDDESEDDDEEMYDDGYADEMEYDEEMSEDDDENVSDEDEELGEMGHIEGLPGEPAVMEVIMGDQDGEDESMDEDDDEDDSSEDDDDEISDALEEVEDHHEVVDENGSPVEDDGASEWESDSDNENDEGEEEIDFEAEVQDLDERAQLGHFGNINYAEPRFSHDFLGDFPPMDDRFVEEDEADDDEEDEEDEMDEDVFIFDRDNMGDGQPQPNIAPGLGWDSLVIDQPSGAHRHRHGGIRSPFPVAPQAVVIGGPHGDRLSEFRNFFRPRNGPPTNSHDDGVNPLLRRHRNGGRDASPRPGMGPTFRFPPSFFSGGHENPITLINDLITSMPQSMGGRGGVFPSFQLHISQEGPHGEVHEFHIPVPAGAAQMRDSRNDASRSRDIYHEPQHAVSFMPASTSERWMEEAKMIFGPAHHEKSLKLFLTVLSRLAPQAIADDKEAKRKEAERKRELEEARRRHEEEERRKKAEAEAEAKAAREKEEAERKAKEEREAAEAAEAALLQASQSETNSATAANDNQASEPQGMEGVETAEAALSGSHVQQAGDSDSQERLVTSIRGEQIDITGLGIDPEYLAALPEEFREEVIAQTLTTRRSEARQQAENTGQETEAFNEFLDALPEELRQEIIQQEAQERRRRQREERQRDNNANNNNNVSVPQEMDAASILLTFDATLREEILMDQHEELAEHLPADMVAQARLAAERRSATAASAVYRNREAVQREGQRSDHSRQVAEAVAAQAEVKPARQPVPQMLDKAGVATLLRLMFISQPAAIRTHHFGILSDVCENRQNRLEVISTLLQILQDGSTDMDAVERSFGQLSLKARQPKEKDLQKTPTSLKRSLTNINPGVVIQHNSDVSPLMIVQQCLDLLGELCRNLHIPSLFLTEHEILGSSLKRTLSRKGKGKDLKANKYAINSLLSLLGRSLVMESSAVMQLLADLLNKVTYPLQALERRRREAEEEAKKTTVSEPATNSTEAAGASTAESQAGQSSSTATDNNAEAAPTATAAPGPAAEQADADADKSKTEETKAAEAKKSKQLQPPVIPFHNLTLVVNIFVARECSSKTFQNTISTIKNLSNIPGAKMVFGQELVRQARLLSENIVRDLDDLLPHILKAESGTEIQGVALAKFSPGASEQNKLLRVLTALDHLFDSRAKKTDDELAGKESEKQEFISSLYHNSTFGTMWEKLSACLSAIHQRENMVNVATILLPLIESLMVVCKNTTLSDAPTSQSQMSKEMLLSSPPPENRMAGLFFNFTEDHRRVLNELVRNNPKLMSGTFSLLVKNPKVLEFDNKRNYFNRSVHAKSGNQTRPSYAPLQLSVRRDHVFHDSFKSLYFKKGEEMKYGKLNIRFHGEEGVDAGGVTREWFQVLSRQMFDPNYVLFIPVSSDRTTFHPNKLSSINDEHLMFFKFIGRIIGKALYEGRVLDCYFSRAVYKRILGKPVSVKDMESFDPEYYKSLVWMLENDITDIITETFAVEDDAFGATETVDLCENGRHIPVTEDNKHDYVRLVVEHKLLASVKDQMAEFLTGFHDIIPAELIAIFNEQELELLISGLPDIDVDDWKSHTEYHNYTPSSQQIQWFWRAVRSFDKEERAKLLQFVTGTSKVPLNGFKELEGMNGVSRFNIHRDYGNKERLPSSHTCFNQLDLPEYESYEILRAQIMKAITAGSDYFGFA
ncbi:E3 ubiquitin-protein ligase ptr1 + RNA transporter 1 [Magnaporthiopsis poae ATCC 64411]|uniref:HECT-type E3 ubiquitin transferase n=1 Tax=Magnaporthiopsis poae (strain ATCC 64411 / 73-15) TaxID=644358 RepID=A0A0C4DLT2_MAGP6|nr:E3 ubiquitin-protein ligase ptr1 + RNA transporter 1 [Magnaporthiopsis poae ATCC 64411]